MDDHAARRGAALARCPERRPGDTLDGQIEVGVVHHDDPVLAAELEVDVLEIVGCGLRDEDARLARPRERDDGNVGVAHEAVAGLFAEAVDDVDDAGREARLGEELDEPFGEEGRVLGRLEDDGVSADERGRELPGRDRDREVPGRDRADDPDRQPDGHLELVAQLGRCRLAEHAASFAGHVDRHVDRLLYVSAGLGEHLPHLVAHQLRELLLVAREQLGEAEE